MRKSLIFASAAVVLLCLLLPAGCAGPSGNAGGEQTDGGKLFAAKATPIPTPAPTPMPRSAVFAQGLQEVLSAAAGHAEGVQSLQADRLFLSGQEPDAARSNTARATVTFKGDDGGVIETVSRLDAATGDASFTLASRSGEETVEGAGLFFVGSDLIIRRAGTKPMVRYTPDAALLSTYKTLSAMDRAARVLSKDGKPEKVGEEWDARIAQFVGAATAGAKEGDYAQGAAEVTLLSQPQKLDAITLSLAGSPAKVAVGELLSLVRENSGLSGLMSAGESDTQRLDSLEATLHQATDASCAVTVAFLQDVAVSAQIGFALDGEETSWTLQSYEKGFERHHLILFAFSDGAQIRFEDKNVSAGGDKYKGELRYMAKDADGKSRGDITAISDSVSTDTQYQAGMDINFTMVMDDGDDRQETPFHIVLDWAQEKTADGGATGSGSGSVSYDDDGKTETKEFELALEQSYADAAIDAPKFIDGAGVSAATREEALKALDIDAGEFDAQPAQTRVMTLLFALMR